MFYVCTQFSALFICMDSLWLFCIFLKDELAVISVSSTIPNGPLGNGAIKTLTYRFLCNRWVSPVCTCKACQRGWWLGNFGYTSGC